ncbi:MAG: M48 family metallopeptidase [Myxococcota bacterium]|nr:M48 family metallopeptidase [Myxococcota bacterium]
MSASTYKEMLAGEAVARSGSDVERLRKVGKRVAKVANRPDYRWRFNLIEDKQTVNAWCLPGGKIAFYEGILPVLRNEAGMAFVMGHEVAHATARHGAERVTQQLAVFGGLTALYAFIDRRVEMTAEQRNTLIAALGVDATVGVQLPFSRKHEKEADVIGMMYMARAGYPPGESIRVWDRMRAASGGSGPTFMSTHPSHRQRQQNLNDWLPRARKRYQRNRRPGNMREAVWR